MSPKENGKNEPNVCVIHFVSGYCPRHIELVKYYVSVHDGMVVITHKEEQWRKSFIPLSNIVEIVYDYMEEFDVT